MEILKKSRQARDLAAKIINSGGVVICPTDTVYGFLADAKNKKAVSRIYKIKKRERLKPLPVFVKNIKTAIKIAIIDSDQKKLIKKYWPGKYTFVLKKKKGEALYGVDRETIALRVPKYKFLNDLLKKINKPLSQTSVNASGTLSLKKIEDIIKEFGGKKKWSRFNN